MNETELIKSAQKGNLPAFNRLVMAHQGLAYNVAYRLMGEGEAAADATQEAFIKAFKSINQYRGGSFKSWLLRIVTNTCYDHLRYARRRPSEPLEPEHEDLSADYTPHLLDPAAGPEERTLQHELGRMLQEAINQLPPEQRLILLLSDAEGFSYQEIAEITDLALGTVKSRLNRGRARLRDILLAKELLPPQYRLQTKDH
jgi:RNA polymerase sigma-70 factor, ECF subfamily